MAAYVSSSSLSSAYDSRRFLLTGSSSSSSSSSSGTFHLPSVPISTCSTDGRVFARISLAYSSIASCSKARSRTFPLYTGAQHHAAQLDQPLTHCGIISSEPLPTLEWVTRCKPFQFPGSLASENPISEVLSAWWEIAPLGVAFIAEFKAYDPDSTIP